jgi:alkylated DNA nucleotide flippase Atl1
MRPRRDTIDIQPRIVTLTTPKGNNYPVGRMLIASPAAISALLERVPNGCVLKSGDLRTALAGAYGADYTCPMTTGIFLRMAAESADAAGADDAVPWWRVVRDDGGLIDTLPGGSARQARQLQREGLTTSSAKRPRVANLDAHAWTVTATARRAARLTIPALRRG